MLVFKKIVKWYGEGDAGAGDTGNAGAGDTGAGNAGDGGTKSTFTQEDVNRIVAAERRQSEQTIKLLKETIDNRKGDDGKDVTAKLAEIQKTHESQLQVVKDEHGKKLTKAEKEYKELQQKHVALESEYHNTLISTSITGAASKHNAFNPAQILSMVSANAKVQEVIGADGKVAGKKVVVSLPSIEDATKSVTLPAEEAIKYMYDHPESYGNLFKSHLEGANLGGKSGGKAAPSYQGDFESFRKARTNTNG